MTYTRWLASLAIIPTLVALLAGCGTTTSSPSATNNTPSSTTSIPPSTTVTSAPSTSPTSTSPTPTPTSNTAAIAILQPITGSVQIDANVTITVQVSGIALVDKAGQANVQGEGHLIYYLDVDPPTAPGSPALTAAGTYVISVSTSYQWPDLPDAAHTIWVELVNNDNTPLNPPVTAKVSISVFTG